MIDREKIIEKLEKEVKRTYAIKTAMYEFGNNSYEKISEEITEHREPFVSLTIEMADKILALLKEQEAVEPIPPTDESDLWRCGNCNHQLFRATHQRYCPYCGREVKWE